MQTHTALKESVIQILDEMPVAKVAEVLDFARFLKSKTQSKEETDLPIVKVGSFADLKSLIGKFDLEGDAVVDCEKYWE